MGVETLHQKRDGEQVTVKQVEVDDDVVEFEGPPGGPYEFAGEGKPPRAAVRTLQEAVDEDIKLDVDEVVTPATDAGEPADPSGSSE